MNALAISMVKNEADIVEASIRHNLRYVDLYVVIENASTDGTREILEAMRAEGLPLLIVDDPVFGHFQSEKVTEVYRRVVPVFQPELVYLLDADEFIRAPSRAALEGALSNVEPGGVALLPWVTHLPDPEVHETEARRDPLGCARYRRRLEEPVYHKAVIRRHASDDGRIRIEQGNHGVGWVNGGGPPMAVLNGAAIAHLPVRSVGQLTAKVINGWLACMARNRVRDVPGEAYQWQQLHERIVRGPGLRASDLVEAALNYAQQSRAGRSLQADAVVDPTPSLYGTLRYLDLGRHDPLAKVALAFEQHLRPSPRSTDAIALDLAPLRDLVSRLAARTVAATPGGRRWADALIACEPRLSMSGEGDVDLLLAPDGATHETLAQAGLGPGVVPRRVVTWVQTPCSGRQLDLLLRAWAAAGWAPDLLETLSGRALASYAQLRNGLIVLRPIDAEAGARAALVRAVLSAMRDAPPPWTDPAPQRIDHPLQSLALEAS